MGGTDPERDIVQAGVPAVTPAEFCYLGGQESLEHPEADVAQIVRGIVRRGLQPEAPYSDPVSATEAKVPGGLV